MRGTCYEYLSRRDWIQFWGWSFGLWCVRVFRIGGFVRSMGGFRRGGMARVLVLFLCFGGGWESFSLLLLWCWEREREREREGVG